MKNRIILFLMFQAVILLLIGCTEGKTSEQKSGSSKEILLQQLKNTHTAKDWFVPVNIALEGVSAEEAMWRDSSGNHSIGQLAYHLLFWNKRQLAKFNGQPEGEFSGNNDETFNSFTKENWNNTVSELDSVLTSLEQTIEAADEDKLREWYPTIANISAHNAYHTGQIIFVRKLQQSWDAEKGVK